MPLIDMDIADDDSYPVGDHKVSQAPCVYLTAAQVKALGITEPPRAGATLTVQARAMVERSSESIDGDMDDPDITMCLLLTHMELGAVQPPREAATALYGGSGG